MKRVFIKLILLFFIGIFFTGSLYGQRILVRSENTGQAIPNVAVFNRSREKAAITDSTGHTGTVLFNPTDTIIFQHPSYNTLQVAYAEIMGSGEVKLSKRYILFDEFIISASKTRESKQLLPYNVSVMQQKNLINNTGQTSADILLQTGNVLIQKTQAGGGSPILRGFEANKILLVVDGVRLNNAIYRNGHLQNSITIDNSILERTEVIFGPSSLIYGSDALGGVIHYFTRDPEFADSSKLLVKGEVYTQYSTANNGKVGHFNLNLGGKKIASLSSFTVKDFGLVEMGSLRNRFYGDWGRVFHHVERFNGKDSMMINDNPDLQYYTDYSQIDILQKFKYQKNLYSDWTMNLQYSTSSNIDRLDKLNDYSGGYLKYAEYYYGPQDRFLASIRNVNRNNNRFFTNATSTLAYQDISEERVSRQFNNDERLFQIEGVKVLSLNLDLLKIWGKEHRLNYGYDFIYNFVDSRAYYEDISSLLRSSAQTRYPSGGSNTFSTSLYGSYKLNINDKLVLNGGIRYNYSLMNSVFSDPMLPFDTTYIKNGALTGNVSLVYHPTPEWQINTILSTGYRNPNVDDYGKIRAKDDYIIIPNPDINPEYTYNAEIGLSRVMEGFLRMDVVAFYTLLTDAIVRTDYSLNGSDSLLYDGDMYRITANYNAQLAQIYGISVNVISDFYNHMVFKGSMNFTKGLNISDGVPLGHIPPVFGRVSMTYDYKKFLFDAFVYYNGWKLSEDFSPYGEDNDEEATSFGYPSWWTLNLHASYSLNNMFRFQFAIENILDQFYKPYASGVSAPGRNYILTIRYAF